MGAADIKVICIQQVALTEALNEWHQLCIQEKALAGSCPRGTKGAMQQISAWHVLKDVWVPATNPPNLRGMGAITSNASACLLRQSNATKPRTGAPSCSKCSANIRDTETPKLWPQRMTPVWNNCGHWKQTGKWEDRLTCARKVSTGHQHWKLPGMHSAIRILTVLSSSRAAPFKKSLKARAAFNGLWCYKFLGPGLSPPHAVASNALRPTYFGFILLYSFEALNLRKEKSF